MGKKKNQYIFHHLKPEKLAHHFPGMSSKFNIEGN